MEAIAFFEVASGAGYDKATEALAEIYYVGIGVAENEQKALPFIMKAAEAGRAELWWVEPIALSGEHITRLVWHRENVFLRA